MVRIFTNGPRKDYVIKPFQELAGGASQIYLAAPYFTKPEPILDAAKKGAQVRLLIGLNESTTPQALAQVNAKPGIAVRYFTGRFHAKIFIFDDVAILGSSNLTEGGLFANREASIRLDQDNDWEVVEEMMALFVELWEAGKVLTPQILSDFTVAHKRLQQGPNPETEIEKAVGKAVAEHPSRQPQGVEGADLLGRPQKAGLPGVSPGVHRGHPCPGDCRISKERARRARPCERN